MRLLSCAHLPFGLGDGEFPYPLLVIHQAWLGAADKLRAQYPPGQTQVQHPLSGTGPVPERDHPWCTSSNKNGLKTKIHPFTWFLYLYYWNQIPGMRSWDPTCGHKAVPSELAELISQSVRCCRRTGWQTGLLCVSHAIWNHRRPTFASAWAPCTSCSPDIGQSGGSDHVPFLCRPPCCCPPRSN